MRAALDDGRPRARKKIEQRRSTRRKQAIHILPEDRCESSLPGRSHRGRFSECAFYVSPFFSPGIAKKHNERELHLSCSGIALRLDKCNTAGRMHRWINFRRYNAAHRDKRCRRGEMKRRGVLYARARPKKLPATAAEETEEIEEIENSPMVRRLPHRRAHRDIGGGTACGGCNV